MALSFNLNPIDTINRLHQVANERISEIKGLPKLKIVNHRVNPDSTDNGSVRLGFEAFLETGRDPTMNISPPSAAAKQLKDWSSPEAVVLSSKAMLLCCEAYCKALEQSNLFDQTEIKQIRAELITDVSAYLGVVGDTLAPPENAIVSKESAEKFKNMRDLINDPSDLGQMAAARFVLRQLPADEAKTLMIQSDLSFNPIQELEKELAAQKQKNTPPAAIPSFKKRSEQKAFTLYANGSFSSRAHSASDNPVELARIIASPEFDLGIEHMAHRHYLSTPDGTIWSMDNIMTWAESALRHVDAFEIASQTRSASPRAKVTL